MTVITAPPHASYTCPGEAHPISRSVHLARLGAFYAACRDCPHRGDTGLLSTHVLTEWDRAPRSARVELELTDDGVRGRYLNDLDRRRARLWAAAFAAHLWDERPLLGRVVRAEDHEPAAAPSRLGPTVVVGYDERPSSPDLAVGVVTGLRQMGCRVVDVGLTTKPVWWFAGRRLSADGGVFVTGAGCDAAWTGLDFLGPAGLPLPADSRTLGLWERVAQPIGRPTRTPGAVSTFSALVPYEASLWPQFHALRPLHVVCGCATALTGRSLERLFAQLPCRLTLTPLSTRASQALSGDGAGALEPLFVPGAHDVGFAIGEDGQSCAAFDEQGRPISPAALQRWLVSAVLRAEPQGQVAAATNVLPELSAAAGPHHGRLVDAGATLVELAAALQSPAALLGVDPRGRIWRRDEGPTCDALSTLGLLLQSLSLSDAPFSERLTSG